MIGFMEKNTDDGDEDKHCYSYFPQDKGVCYCIMYL